MPGQEYPKGLLAAMVIPVYRAIYRLGKAGWYNQVYIVTIGRRHLRTMSLLRRNL